MGAHKMEVEVSLEGHETPARKEDAGHARHNVGDADPAGQNDPAGHKTEQALVRPVAVSYVPAAHRVQMDAAGRE